MLYEKLLTAVEETSTFGLEWETGNFPDIFLASDIILSLSLNQLSFDFGILWFSFSKPNQDWRAVHEELPSSKI